ncbi:MAG TPA: hypothetical protein IGS52_16885 [Oscillatoriaceae cyanobacterium M33_DOE_052]|uniref:Uncharacterized protein n=1 Tax=Planktothricoides sp. SpSt-374 TaxID=2282167 RepID=A0A7C3VSU2_9CYAN|nr:hypothetical protein [Oscillatoriaceae cyanobacterium M33_DOE_052]
MTHHDNETHLAEIARLEDEISDRQREIVWKQSKLRELEWGTAESEDGEIIPISDWMELQQNHHL